VVENCTLHWYKISAMVRFNILNSHIVCFAAPTILSTFQGKFCENFDTKDWIFPKFCHNIQNFGKNCNFQILTKIKIVYNIVYVISQLIFWGQGNCSGRRRNIAERFAETLGKVLGKFCEFHQNFTKTNISPKPQHYILYRQRASSPVLWGRHWWGWQRRGSPQTSSVCWIDDTYETVHPASWKWTNQTPSSQSKWLRLTASLPDI